MSKEKATIKTGLMFSPLTERIFWGKINTKTGVSVGNSQKDITSDFIGIMLQKFPVNTSQNITSNGEADVTVLVLDKDKASRYMCAPDMYRMLTKLSMYVSGFDDGGVDSESCEQAAKDIQKLLAKARGE